MENTEKKAVPKFRTCYEKPDPRGARKVRGLIRWCGVFHREGLAPSYGEGSSGNLSVRIEKGADDFLITACALKLKNKLTANDFFTVTRVDPKKMIVTGMGVREPSSETLLHDAIYKKRADAGAVFHGHCLEILRHARSLNIVETEKEEETGTAELAGSVLRVLGKNKFIIMKDHGFISLGRTMREAGSLALKIHKACLALDRA